MVIQSQKTDVCGRPLFANPVTNILESPQSSHYISLIQSKIKHNFSNKAHNRMITGKKFGQDLTTVADIPTVHMHTTPPSKSFANYKTYQTMMIMGRFTLFDL